MLKLFEFFQVTIMSFRKCFPGESKFVRLVVMQGNRITESRDGSVSEIEPFTPDMLGPEVLMQLSLKLSRVFREFFPQEFQCERISDLQPGQSRLCGIAAGHPDFNLGERGTPDQVYVTHY